MIASTNLLEFPIRAISKYLLEKMSFIADGENHKCRVIAFINAYLEVVGFRLDEPPETLDDIDELLYGFEGYIQVETGLTAHKISKMYYTAKAMLAELIGVAWKPPRTGNKSLPSRRQALSLKYYQFQHKSLSHIRYYSGWFAAANDGRQVFINLSGFHSAYGEKLTLYLLESLNKNSSKFAFNSVRQKIKITRQIILSMCTLYPDIAKLGHSLNSPLAVNQFAEMLFSQRYADTLIKDNSVESFYTEWPQYVRVLTDSFVGTAIMAKPLYPLFCPSYTSSDHNEKVEKSYNQSLSEIPLTIADDAAFKEFGRVIDTDVDHVVRCSEITSQAEMAAYNETIRKAKLGNIIHNFNGLKFGYDFNENDVCSTWMHYSYSLKATGLFKAMNSEAVREIVNPIGAHNLQPHMMLLVKHHPIITPPWLLEFELYDKFGEQANYRKSGDEWIAIGFKPRAKRHQQQTIVLTAFTKQIFDEVITLTKLARNYLKSIGDDNYRFLFLSGGYGFSRPKPIVNLQQLSSRGAYKIPLRSAILQSTTDVVTDEVAARICKKLSLSSLRVNVGIQVFLRTLSRKAVSDALGHSEFSSDLTDDYLHPSIRAFAMERWIRLYQNAIVYEAMKDSPYLLAAMDFNTQEELHDFLSVHKSQFVIVPAKEQGVFKPEDTPDNEAYDRVYVELNLEKLEVLLCIYEIVSALIAAKTPVSSVGLKWYPVATLIYQAFHLHKEGLLKGYCSRSVLALFEKANPSARLAEQLKEVLYVD